MCSFAGRWFPIVQKSPPHPFLIRMSTALPHVVDGERRPCSLGTWSLCVRPSSTLLNCVHVTGSPNVTSHEAGHMGYDYHRAKCCEFAQPAETRQPYKVIRRPSPKHDVVSSSGVANVVRHARGGVGTDLDQGQKRGGGFLHFEEGVFSILLHQKPCSNMLELNELSRSFSSEVPLGRYLIDSASDMSPLKDHSLHQVINTPTPDAGMHQARIGHGPGNEELGSSPTRQTEGEHMRLSRSPSPCSLAC